MKIDEKLYFDKFVKMIKNNCSLEEIDNNNKIINEGENKKEINGLDIYECNKEDIN